MEEEKTYSNGAYGCMLCRNEFSYEVVVYDHHRQLHEMVHISRFFYALLKDDEIREGFYKFCKNDRVMATLIGQAKAMSSMFGGTK